jgi:hypothetical protein
MCGRSVAFAAFLSAAVWASPSVASPQPSVVRIIHGLPGFTADIYLDGELLLDGFQPSESAGPLRVSPGRHDVAVRDIGAAADSAPVLSVTLRVRPGSDTTVVAHLSPQNDPTLTLFDNDFDRLPAGRAVFTVRDLTSLGRLSVRLDGRVLQGAVGYGGERSVRAAPGRHRISFLSSSGDLVAAPSPIDLREGTALIVYAFGDPGDVRLLFQTVAGLHSAPSGVLTGAGGLAAESVLPGWLVATILMVVLVSLAGSRRLARNRT